MAESGEIHLNQVKRFPHQPVAAARHIYHSWVEKQGNWYHTMGK